MCSHIEVEYDLQDLPSYVRDILTSGICSLFPQVGFIEIERRLKASYTADGYRNLSAIEKIGTEEILTIVISVLHGLYQCEKRYLYHEMFSISSNCLFVDKNFSTVKLIYCPDTSQKSLHEKIILLLRQLREKGNEEGYGYIDNAIAFLKENQYGYRAVIHHLETLRREVYACGIA